MTTRDRLLVEINRLGSQDALGQAEDAALLQALGIDSAELHRLAGQLDQLGYLTWHNVSVGSFKLNGAGIREAERLARPRP